MAAGVKNQERKVVLRNKRLKVKIENSLREQQVGNNVIQKVIEFESVETNEIR